MRGRIRVQVTFRIDTFSTLMSYIDVEWHMAILPPVAEQAEQSVAESLSEITIEIGINQWIER